MSGAPERWLKPRHTSNAAMLEGMIAGTLDRAGSSYRFVERRVEDKATTVENRVTGNRFLVSVVQISGTE